MSQHSSEGSAVSVRLDASASRQGGRQGLGPKAQHSADVEQPARERER